MIHRSLPENLVSVLSDHPLWRCLLADRSLSPEVRDGHLTVYYRGGALLQRLRLDGDDLVADVNVKFIPVRGIAPETRMKWTTSGFELPSDIQPLRFDPAQPNVLVSYKEHMDLVLTTFPEGQVVQRIIEHDGNTILDQEIAFQRSGESRDKIDLCSFNPESKKLVFVEVKRVDDERLVQPTEQPDVLEQLACYCRRLESVEDQIAILNAYRTVAAIKRRLGLRNRLMALPDEGAASLLTKPVLVIGNCSRADVRAILSGADEWKPLMDALPKVAAGVILCGKNGCQLKLSGRQARAY